MKKIKVLYAEDEYITCQDHVAYMQSRYNFEVIVAGDGEEALELYKKHRPEIVMTDITMPKMSGLELVAKIRKLSNSTKIIILTAHSEPDKLLEALNSQVVNYLIKPINRKKLKDSLDLALETLVPATTEEEDGNILKIGSEATFHLESHEYRVDGETVKLTHYESALLLYLCERKNITISSHDIFTALWNDLDKEYSAESVRTLVKKLRKKLPEDTLKNIYGGYYKLEI